jgi:isopenicillin-N N-acyltransferase-like protein
MNSSSSWDLFRTIYAENVGNYVLRITLRSKLRKIYFPDFELIRVFQIGFQHGSQAKKLVHGSIEFYDDYFQRMSKMNWATAENVAMKFRPFLEQHVPHLVEEMQGRPNPLYKI